MRAPLSWLRDYAPFASEPQVLAETLDDLGLVVEDMQLVGEGLGDIVVAKVTAIGAIEGADRIRRVVVDTGNRDLSVVCGAWNFQVGDLVPLAPVGSVLPGGMSIGRRKMRGVVSEGMICSGAELHLSDDHQGIMVLSDVAGASAGAPLTEVLGIEADVVYDLSIEGDRPDAWSIIGVARALAARLGLPFSPEAPPPAEPGGGRGGRVLETGGQPAEKLTSVVVEDLDLCPRFTARVITGTSVVPSPRWMARRLTLTGMRPINNLVDASNYVMLELGQPSHPYDLDRLGGGGIIVRRARPGERVRTLDGEERELGRPGPGLGDRGDDCLICDANSVPIGIGGIMGGASTEIAGQTSSVLLETAYFTPLAISRTATRLALRTEASARFEKGCDPWGIDRAADRFVELLGVSGTGGMVAPESVDVRGSLPEPFSMPLEPEAVNALLGTALDGEEMAALLAPLGFSVGQGNGYVVTVPTSRPDIRSEPFGLADLAEEVARAYSYARIPRRRPAWPDAGYLTRYQRERRLVRQVLVGLGADEVWTPSLVSSLDHEGVGIGGPEVELANPQSRQETVLRRSMLAGHLKALASNIDRQRLWARLFEVGVVFDRPAPGVPESRPTETEMLSVLFGWEEDDAESAAVAWSVLSQALRLEGVRVERAQPAGLHPTRSARLVIDAATQIGVVGEVDASVAARFGVASETAGRPTRRLGWLQVDLSQLLDPSVVVRRDEAAMTPSRYPAAEVDLAFVVDDAISAEDVRQSLVRAGGASLESVQLFDVYRGASVESGQRSLAFRVRYRASDKTLSDTQVSELRAAAIAAVEEAHQASLR